ncbi:MAG TPA: hypothetical protein VEC99_00005 [Clostridia bacterium]|nr:hypothetical protein [Clostridia bacterium]
MVLSLLCEGGNVGLVPLFLLTKRSAEAAYRLQATTNLVHWIDFAVLTNAAGALNFMDRDMTNYPSRFYRRMIP